MTTGLNQAFGKAVRCPWDDSLDRLEEVLCRRRTDPSHVALPQISKNILENSQHGLPRSPFFRRTQQVFFCYHFEDGPNVLRHAAVNQNEALLELAPGVR